MNAPWLTMLKAMNELFADSDEQWSYHLIKKLILYDDKGANDLSNVTMKTAV